MFIRFLLLLLLVAGSAAGSGCSTKIRAYKVTSAARVGGIPFFLPKPVVSVKEPIETKRAETVYALVELGGTELFLYQVAPRSDFTAAIQRLHSLRLYGSKDKISLVPAPDDVAFLSKDEVKIDASETTTTGEKEKKVSRQTLNKIDLLREFEAVAGRTAKDEPQLYKSGDISKAFEIVMIPDYEREFELLIQPRSFAGSKIEVKLKDGWMLESLNADTDESTLVKNLTDLVSGVITAQKEIKLAEIGKEQALELARLAGEEETDEASERVEEYAGEISKEERIIPETVRFVGYVKKVEVSVLTPGLYPISCSIKQCKFDFPFQQAVYWRRLEF